MSGDSDQTIVSVCLESTHPGDSDFVAAEGFGEDVSRYLID
jgi:hypothetical protein